MPKTIHNETQNGIPMAIIRKDGKGEKEAKEELDLNQIWPPRNFDSTYNPFFSPLKRGHLLQPEFDHPFIYTPYVNRTVSDLLQIADQSSEEHQDRRHLYYPPNLELYDSNRQLSQWCSCAHYMGIPLESCSNPYLTNNGGLTLADRSYIQHGLKLGWEVEYIWR
jgi:hypothetical protein